MHLSTQQLLPGAGTPFLDRLLSRLSDACLLVCLVLLRLFFCPLLCFVVSSSVLFRSFLGPWPCFSSLRIFVFPFHTIVETAVLMWSAAVHVTMSRRCMMLGLSDLEAGLLLEGTSYVSFKTRMSWDVGSALENM
jgi:hypothetical protein